MVVSPPSTFFFCSSVKFTICRKSDPLDIVILMQGVANQCSYPLESTVFLPSLADCNKASNTSARNGLLFLLVNPGEESHPSPSFSLPFLLRIVNKALVEICL